MFYFDKDESMALCKRKTNQNSLWVEARHLRPHGSHPFDRRLNEILERAKYDRYREWLCRKYNAPTRGRPSMAPGVCFRCFPVGSLEDSDFERGIASRILGLAPSAGVLGAESGGAVPRRAARR